MLQYEASPTSPSPERMVKRGLRVLLVGFLPFGISSTLAQAEAIELTQELLKHEISALRQQDNVRDYVVREPLMLDQIAGSSEEWYVRDLTFREGAVLYLADRDLVLRIEGRLVVEGPEQLVAASFPGDHRRATSGTQGANGDRGRSGRRDGEDGSSGAPGGPGTPGKDGLSAGDLTLHLRRAPALPFRISLVGQDGGHGGAGGRGGDGGDGAQGRVGKSGPFGCERGGGDGGDGGRGGRGGDGGAPGRCGSGGTLTVLYPRVLDPVIRGRVLCEAQIAVHGDPGPPGRGGTGGGGGGRGRGSGFCGGGKGGDDKGTGVDGAIAQQDNQPCTPAAIRFLAI